MLEYIRLVQVIFSIYPQLKVKYLLEIQSLIAWIRFIKFDT